MEVGRAQVFKKLCLIAASVDLLTFVIEGKLGDLGDVVVEVDLHLRAADPAK